MATNTTAQAQTSSSFIPLKPSDLSDPLLWRLNQDFQFIYQKLSTLFSPGSSPSYPISPTFQQVFVSAQSQPPTDSDAVLTRANGDQLYGPAASRQSLTSGAYPSANPATQPNPVQPLAQNVSVSVANGGALSGPKINFIAGSGITITVTSDPITSVINVTIST